MLEPEGEAPHSGLKLNDILFIVFKHKIKILLCAGIGIAAAAAIYFFLPALYESQAKLFVRYVVDRSAVDGLDATGKDDRFPNRDGHHFRSGDSDQFGSRHAGRRDHWR